MKSHRTITRMVALLVALAAAAPASAQATSLLSGYGGPGQGNQALLGSGLLPGGSGGGGSAGGGSTPLTAVGNAPAAVGSGSGSGVAPTSRVHRHAAASHAKPSVVGEAGASENARRTYQAYVRALSTRPAAGDSVLGLSGSDLLLVLLALAALLFTALLAKGLGRDDWNRKAHG